MTKILLRVREENSELYVFDRNGSGMFELGDPKFGNEKHHSLNEIEVSDLSEAIKLVERGYHPRMRGIQSNQTNMISPKNVKILEVPV